MSSFFFLVFLVWNRVKPISPSSRASKTKEIRTKEMTAGMGRGRPFLNEEEEEATNTTTTTAALPRDVLVVRVFARKWILFVLFFYTLKLASLACESLSPWAKKFDSCARVFIDQTSHSCARFLWYKSRPIKHIFLFLSLSLPLFLGWNIKNRNECARRLLSWRK